MSQANILYINSLNLPSLKEVAIQWMQDRQSEVDEVLHELRIALRSGSILGSRSVSEYSQRSLNSSNRQLELEAEQAALELEQAKRRAAVNRQLAGWEAEKLKQKAELMAQEEVEKAQLKARGLQTLAEAALHHEDEGMAVLPDETDVKQSEQVNKWLLEQTVDPQVRPKTDKLPWLIPETDQASPESFQVQRAQDQVVNSGDSKARQKCDIQTTNMNNAVPLVSVSGRHPGYHGGTHTMQTQGQQLPVISNRKQMPGTLSIAMNVESEPIDAWIDELIPGVETVHDNSSLSTDYLREAIVKFESEGDLPAVDLPTFGGAALEWPRFIEQFHLQVHCRPGISDNRRMDLLQSHLKGEASLLVKGLGYSGRNYAQVLQELKGAFGHRVRVAGAYLDTVTYGPAVATNDPAALRQFYVSVRDCVTTLRQLQYTSDLYSFNTLMRAAKRLPFDKIAKWNSHVRDILQNREPTLIDLLNWLKKLVDVDYKPYAIPLPARKSAKPDTHRQGDKPQDRGKRMTFSTTVQPTSKGQSSSDVVKRTTDKPSSVCPVCSDMHSIYKCTQFLNMSTGARHQFIKQHKLCFNCLRSGHVVKCAICSYHIRVIFNLRLCAFYSISSSLILIYQYQYRNINTLLVGVYTYINKYFREMLLCGYSHTTILSGVLASEEARRGVSPRSTGLGQDIFLLTVTPCKPHLYHKNIVISRDG